MAITASTITSGQTLEDFRQQFNKLISDVNDIKDNSTFTSTLVFEGSSADDFETSLTVTNPTADRTITIPNETGTVLTTASTVTGSNVVVTDNESTNENNAIVFVADADLDGGTVALESDGDLTYNPSTSTLTATTFSGALSGNATTATALATSRTIASTGDVTWTSASFDGSGNVTGTAAIGTGVIINADVNASAAIAMSKTALVGGTGLTLSTNTLNVDAAQSQITSVGTLTGLVIADDGNIGSASDTDSMTIDATGNVTVSQNLLVSGTLEVQGATTTISSTNSVIADSLIELNTGASSNANDLGFIFERGSTGDNAALVWVEASDKFKLGTTTAIGTATGSLTVATGTLISNLEGDVTGALTGNADTATQFTTTANDTANETVYPVFVDAQTGAQDAETDVALTYNPSTGIITSTGYTGTLQTAAQANITSVGTLSGVVIADDGNIGSASDTNAMAISAAGVVSFSQGIEPAEYVHLVGDEKELRWYNGSNYVGFAASTSLSGNQIWKMPVADGSSSGDALITDAAGNLSFSAVVGSNAATVTVADESSDTTCFPLFATGASGSLAAKSAAGLTFNSATDTLTATAFAGPLTGNVTGNASGTAATVTGAAQSAITSVGTLTSVVIADDGNIGSASDTDSMAINATGQVTFSQQATFTGGLKIADGGNVGANSDTDAIAISAAGLVTFTQDVQVEDDIIMDSDGAILSMGEANEIQVIHETNSGVVVKHNATGDGSAVRVTLETGEENIELDDVIGSLQYRAIAETAGTDANLVAAAIEAVSEGDFSASNNATKLSFMTGVSEAASEAMSLSSTGELTFPNKQGGDNIILNQTAAAGTDAGDDVTLNGTDGSSTNANSNILMEEAVALTTQTGWVDVYRMIGELGEKANNLFPNKLSLCNSSGQKVWTYHTAGMPGGSEHKFGGAVIIVVTVGGGKFLVNGVSQGTLNLTEGRTYVFDVSSTTISGGSHVFALSTTSNGTHSGGVAFVHQVSSQGTGGTAGDHLTIRIPLGAPTLYYYCTAHSAMGGQINTNALVDIGSG
jgi:hypothetical protein